MKFHLLLNFGVALLVFISGVILGEVRVNNAANATIELVKQTYEERSATDEHNDEVFGQYIDGTITQDEASLRILEGTRKHARIALKQLKGTVNIGAYDPASDPHARPGSRFGEKSCVIPKGKNEFNCGQDLSAKVQCVIFATFSDGPMKGTIFYGKSCDGVPICRLLKSGDEVIITYDYSKFVPAK